VIVNHTAEPAETVCTGVNAKFDMGDPTQHGEIVAIQNCSRILRERGYTPEETLAAFGGLSLYTNAEACPMVSALTSRKEMWNFI
jgi:tRNA(Arg) A34 adenosine deaminase TadA